MSSDAERAMAARIAAHVRWGKCKNPANATQPAREKFLQRFVEEADPDRAIRAKITELGPDTAEGKILVRQLARNAAHLRSAHFTRLAMASARARRRRS